MNARLSNGELAAEMRVRIGRSVAGFVEVRADDLEQLVELAEAAHRREQAAVIDRNAEREATPLLERVKTTRGLVHELDELHCRVVEGEFLPRGDLADRFSLLTGMAIGTIWRLEKGEK